MEEHKKCKNKTSHRRPQCAKWFSRYSIFKSGIWAGWTSPFCRLSTSFSLLSMMSQAQCCKAIKKWKCIISGVCCLICLKLCMLLEISKGIWFNFKFRFHGNQNQNDCLLFKKQKMYCLSKQQYFETVQPIVRKR